MWFEGEGNGTDMDKASAEVEKWLTDEVEARIDKFLDSNPTVEQVAEALGAEVTLADVAQDNREKGFKDVHVEEPPPLPSEAAEEVRTPIAENGDELVSFLVQRIVIIEGDSGQNYAKIFGGNVMKFGASAWPDKMEDIFGDIQDLDHKQELPPPYPIKAFCTVSEKGYANRVQYFEKA
jgi:hypothetical protein